MAEDEEEIFFCNLIQLWTLCDRRDDSELKFRTVCRMV